MTAVRNAEKYLAAAMLEIVNRNKKMPSGDPSFDAKLAAEAARLRQQCPAGFAEVEAQKDKRHWSGIGRSQLIEWVANHLGHQDLIRDWYRLRSWDTHHVVAGLVYYREFVTETEGRISFGEGVDLHERMETVTRDAYELLADAWELFCERFRVPPMSQPV